VRGDSHYGRIEAMTWCERNRISYIFGLAGNRRARNTIEHPTRDIDKPAVQIVRQTAVENTHAAPLDDPVNRDNPTKPGMPRIEDLALLSNMGFDASCSTTKLGRICL
jgi:hypothetical protein